MGLSPEAEGQKDGRKNGEARLSWRGWPTAERVAQIAVTYRKVGEGRIIAPILKRRWVSWYVTRPPQQPHSLHNQ